MMNLTEVETTLKLLEEAVNTGEEVLIECPCDNCEECPYEKYCK